MGRAKNTINQAEVSSTPIKVRYSSTYPSNSLSDNGIIIQSGSNIAYSPSMLPDSMSLMNNYRVIRQLYYQYYITGSLLNSASFWDPAWVSTAASSSGNETNYTFPIGANENILIYSIQPTQFGEQVGRGTFIISGSNSEYYITDDGDGNLIDRVNGEHVGNIFYAQGIAVVTNQDYTYANYLATEDYDVYETENDIDIIIE